MPTEEECLEALRAAARKLGESPTKAAYEGLGATPSASTILRVCGGWNEAKERAGLTTNPSHGSRVSEKPDDVSLPEGVTWAELSQDQRWHYRNAEKNTNRTLRRRQRLRAWLNSRKEQQGCSRCETTDPRCLDFHHTDPEKKEMAVGEMVTYGYGRERLADEMSKCAVLCANCHREEHRTGADQRGDDGRDRPRDWSRKYKRRRGCARCEEDDPRCLVFHHEDEKRATVANMISDGKSVEALKAEAESCVVLCSNCHRKEHVEPPETGGTGSGT